MDHLTDWERSFFAANTHALADFYVTQHANLEAVRRVIGITMSSSPLVPGLVAKRKDIERSIRALEAFEASL